MDDGRFSSFRKEAKGYVHFLGARKRNQKNIHPYPSSPYMERLKLRTAETDSSECVLVSRDDAMGFSGSKNRGFRLAMAVPDDRKVLWFKGYGLRCLHIKNISLELLRKSERLMPLSGVIYVFFH